MELKIYDKTGTLKLTASPNSSSTATEEVGGECAVSASFTHTAFVMLDVNDYIEVDGVRYKVRSPYRPTQKNTQTYEYSVKFYAPIHDAEDALMLYTADGDIRSEFSYDGGPRAHLQLWVDNMNRIAGGAVWSIGTVITGENKTIEYNNMFCWDAAFGSSGIAATFDTEMWADGFVINLCKASRGVTVQLGYMQGLTRLKQEDNGEVKFFTRLFPLGSTRNIDASKYGHARLQLPSGAVYVDRNTDLYGIKEGYEADAFSGIFPKYTGTVTSVRSEEKEDEDGRKYTVYYFKDSGMDFNPLDYQIPDLTFMLAFQTGDLAGRGDGEDGSFQAAWHEDSSEWEIINVWQDSSTQIPGGSVVPAVGDTYFPWNFTLPQEYITAAEQEYAAAVDDFLSAYSFDPKRYTGITDRNYIEENGTSLILGQNVRLLSDKYFSTGYKDTRIVKCVRRLNDLSQATITCSDQIGTGWKASVDNRLSDLQYEVARKVEQTFIDIIRTGDSKTPSNYNVFSALKSLSTHLCKDREDQTEFLQKFLKGIEIGKFKSGLLGTGGAVLIDDDGNSHAEFDYITIRKVALFIELIVQQMKYVGGAFIVTPSGMTVSRVEETTTGYKCYFERTDGEKTLQNQFTVGAQARRQTFNLTNQAYYWRLVTAVGDDWIELSKTDFDKGSTIPQAGDEIVGLGHRTDKTRQSAIIISAYGTDAPSIKYYQGINSYSLVDREIKSDYYDPTTGRFKSITYGDTYIGARDKSTFVSYDQDEGVNIKGKVSIQSGSSGVGNFEDLPDEIQKAVQIGAENLLLNTSFAGDYEPLSLDSETKLSGTTDLYSPKLIGWGGSAKVVEDENFISGFGASLGNITQKIRLINGENYVVSYKAKGTSVKVIIGGITIEQKLTSQYATYRHVFTDNGWLLIEFTGNCVIGEIKLERGTIATDWCPSVNDPSKDKEGFKHLFDIQTALKGKTQFYGGLGLTTMIQLGVWENDVLTKINAGISGIWNNDTDVAFWAGGSYEEAIATVQKIINGETPTDEEWKSLAKFVVTHGGDVFIRGYIYAMGGYFRGLIDLGNGNIRLNADGTGWIGVNEEGEKFIEIEKNSVNFNGRIHAGAGSSIGNLQISENGSLYGYSSTIERAVYSNSLIPGTINEAYINNFIKNNIGIASTFFLVFQGITTGTHTVYLPNSTDLFAKKPEVFNGVLTITLFVPRIWNFLGSNIDNNATFEIKAESGTAIYDNNGNETDKISVAKGDILELMSCFVTKRIEGSSTAVGTVEVEYYIKSLRQ